VVPTPARRSARIKLRRGIGLTLMNLVVPGSAEIAHGNRTAGRIAVRVWGICVLAALLLAVALLVAHGPVISLYTNPVTLTVLSWLVPVLGLGWALLVADAWRIATPAGMTVPGRIISGALALALVLGIGGTAYASHGFFGAQSSLIGDVFTGGGEAETEAGRYNILLLGGDAGADRVGLRPDSITVASISVKTGRTVLFSLPRNMQRVPFPTDSPLYELYPNGYYCPEKDLADLCMLNGIYTEAMNHKKLFKGVKYPGVEATKGAVEETLGLKINYWAMIDLQGFEKLIDALGGITLDIGKKVPIGSVHGVKGVYGWIKPGKAVHLDGFHALWFARSREYSTDYERMQRQKCVMNAMVQQLDPMTVLTNFQQIAEASGKVVATDLPADQISTMLDLAVKVKSKPMSSVSFTPPLIKPANPNFKKIKAKVAAAIIKSEAKDEPKPTPSESAAGETSGQTSEPAAETAADAAPAPDTAETAAATASQPKESASATPSEDAAATTEADDLGEVCSVA
jgi:LCP family protein required for cell wall assembly